MDHIKPSFFKGESRKRKSLRKNLTIKLARIASPLKEVDIFEMEHNGTSASSNRENSLKYYKILKNNGYSKQLKSTTPKIYKHSKDEKPRTSSLTSKTHDDINNCQQNNPTDETSSQQKRFESKNPQKIDDSETETVAKEAIASSNDNYVVSYRNGKMLITKDNKENYLKSTELKRSTSKINDVTNCINTNEFVFNEVRKEQIVDKNEKYFTKDSNRILNQIDSSQQTEIVTINFGGQKNDDEMDELLKKQEKYISIFKESIKEYERSIKELRNEIVSQQKTIIEQRNMIDERERIIKEREKMLEERNLIIREREQKIKEHEDKKYDTDRELANLEKSNFSLVTKLNDQEIFCKENHKGKPKPRTRKAKTQPTPNIEIIQKSKPQESQQIRVQGPNFEFEWTGELDSLTAESTPNTSGNVYTPHRITARQPDKSKPNQCITINEQVNRFFNN